ncbi:MAG TPA: helix-turn-helix domain-containing protein [Devosia sp.]|nr:helix-turn-helix domain-containing protein [Devosia sp.]
MKPTGNQAISEDRRLAVPDATAGIGPDYRGGRARSSRANSRHGATDQSQSSYPPVEAARRVLNILRVMNALGIASISDLHAATGLPKPSIVRLLETLMFDGYVARDNMCNGYRVTHHTRELSAGSHGIPMVIEASRPWAIGLTQRIKWPVGIAMLDGDEMEIRYWTGSISPLAYTNNIVRRRNSPIHTAMGRAYLAFCAPLEREKFLRQRRENTILQFSDAEEADFLALLERIRRAGYATRDPRLEPLRMTTIGMPIRFEGFAIAAASVTFYDSVVKAKDITRQIIQPLRETIASIEQTMEYMEKIPMQTGDEGYLAVGGDLDVNMLG